MRNYQKVRRLQLVMQSLTYTVKVAEPDVASVPAWAVLRYCDALTPKLAVRYCRIRQKVVKSKIGKGVPSRRDLDRR